MRTEKQTKEKEEGRALANQIQTGQKKKNKHFSEDLQNRVESSLGEDLSSVNIHPESRRAGQLNAKAFTQGEHIHFAPGQFNPNTVEGQKLLGHELAHVQQQRQGRVNPTHRFGQTLLNENQSLEAEANQKGQELANSTNRFIAGSNGPKRASGRVASEAQAPVQRFKIGATDEKKYTRFSSFVKSEMPKKHNDPRALAALNKYGTNTGATKKDIAEEMKWGKGPTINVTALSGANGEFSPGIGSQELRIDDTIVNAYEKAKTDLPAHKLFLESTILHEFTHFLDDQDSTDRAGEEGQDFEEATYGVDIDSVSDATSVLNAQYGPGNWTISLVGKNASYKQRYIVSGAAKGNGTYEVDGTAFTKSIEGPKAEKWRIRIQHNDGSGWKNSELRNVKESAGEYTLRSEDWTDSDFNDLELKVKKK